MLLVNSIVRALFDRITSPDLREAWLACWILHEYWKSHMDCLHQEEETEDEDEEEGADEDISDHEGGGGSHRSGGRRRGLTLSG